VVRLSRLFLLKTRLGRSCGGLAMGLIKFRSSTSSGRTKQFYPPNVFKINSLDRTKKIMNGQEKLGQKTEKMGEVELKLESMIHIIEESPVIKDYKGLLPLKEFMDEGMGSGGKNRWDTVERITDHPTIRLYQNLMELQPQAAKGKK